MTTQAIPQMDIKPQPVMARMLTQGYRPFAVSDDLPWVHKGVVLRSLTKGERYIPAAYHLIVAKALSFGSDWSLDVGMNAWSNLMRGVSRMPIEVVGLNIFAAVLPAAAVALAVGAVASTAKAFMSVAETKLVAIRGNAHDSNLRGVARAFNPHGLTHRAVAKAGNLVRKAVPGVALKPSN